ncbi:universal stress protein [Sedimentimonas flavescens]|uniref:universal stress protein n=1 Tax=Sedimentimonas flavescens TaxID=2851012 RepID=UPI0021A51D5D|nr:universal stress protein [Sedimentimonas flavescens]MCT2541144.1 universal stress protein [Sedimentimonas flavescens]
MYKTILLTIDLEHEASWKQALPVAINFAKAPGATLHILAVVPNYGSALVASEFPSSYLEKTLAKAKAKLEAMVAEQVPAQVKAISHVGAGRVHEVILEYIDSSGADLVVMASHAPDRVREFLVGSNADRVVRRSPVSIHVVRC